MKKERDYHRMHHHRVAQEKNRLVTDLKRIKTHYETYEPLLKTMKDKYELAVRDKVINQIEKDRAVGELKSLKQLENFPGSSSKKSNSAGGLGPTQKRLQEHRAYENIIKDFKAQKSAEEPFITNRHPNDSEFPAENGLNPYLNRLKGETHNVTNLRLSQSIQAHNLPISK
jgi:hypothetical protein